MAYIRFENINKSFGDNHVLKDINLDIEKGEFVTLLGSSGCGKSTLLRCLSGLEKVTSGKIYLDGVDITDVDPRDRGIGMVFQQYSLFPNMSVKDNVAFGLKMKKVPKDEIDKKVKDILEIVGLSDKNYINEVLVSVTAPKLKKIYLGKPVAFDPNIPMEEQRQKIADYLMDAVTELAVNLPRHKVVPYPNLPKKDYPYNKEAES